MLAPLNRVGDREGVRLHDGVVTTAPGWREAYRQFAEAGWTGVSAPEEYGGQGLPVMVEMAVQELWNAGNAAFAVGPMLTVGAIEALAAHGSDELKAAYLPQLVSGEWTATMNLTEPQAGSDLGLIRTRATRAGDGTYRISGQKIFITYGEHDLTENIVHLVLARLPDAPDGTARHLDVPRAQGAAGGERRAGARNRVTAAGIEHKLGLHGAPTCTMVYDERGRIPRRRGEPRPRLHVHDDEPRAAVGRHPGRRRRRARAGKGRSPMRASGGRGGRPAPCRAEPHRRAPRRPDDAPAHGVAGRGVAGALLRLRARDRHEPARARRRSGQAGPTGRAS